MKISDLLPKLSKTYKIIENDNFYVITRDNISMKIYKDQNITEESIMNYFKVAKNEKYKTSDSSNIPVNKFQKDDSEISSGFFYGLDGNKHFFNQKPSGMIPGPDDPIFKIKNTTESDSEEFDVPPGARFDPILPTKNKKKSKGPDPDHFRKPGSNGDLF
ncbi:hypothetical protein DMUE_0350 [Dictyocoela muelleri]|nr:hypothetical protein DMUE_0350 [Dictyocoela muelleri]